MADVFMAYDYYAFGSSMPGRSFNSSEYRYGGAGGQEKDDEITGVTGSHYTAEFWEYDSRTGKRWNIDPVGKPWESGYAAFANNPIIYADPNGDDVVLRHVKYEGGFGSDDFDLTTAVSSGFIYERSKKALAMYMGTGEGLSYVSQFMKKGQTVGGYTATEDGRLSNYTLTLSETNISDVFVGNLASTSTGFINIGDAELSGVSTHHSDAKMAKWIKESGMIPSVNIEFHPLKYDDIDGSEELKVTALANTLGHETFLHMAKKGLTMMVQFEKGNYSAVAQAYKKDTGPDGDYDHSDYINGKKDIGTGMMKRFQSGLSQKVGAKTFNTVKKSHDSKYNYLKK